MQKLSELKTNDYFYQINFSAVAFKVISEKNGNYKVQNTWSKKVFTLSKNTPIERI